MMRKIEELVLCIVGVGQIGGSFALASRENGIGRRIIGVDKPDVIENPSIYKYIDRATANLRSGIKEADFIFLSTPLLEILELLPRIIFHMKPNAVLLDSGSTKKEISVLMSKYPNHILIGGHPMAGTEKAGVEASSPSLFQNRIFALVYPTKKSLKGRKIVLKILKKIGAIPLRIDELNHDCLVSMTSHLPYVLSLSLSLLAMDFLSKKPLFKKFIASGFLGATRLSMTHEEMGRGILSTNSSEIIRRMDEYAIQFERIKRVFENGDKRELLKFLSEIRRFQSEFLEKNENLN